MDLKHKAALVQRVTATLDGKELLKLLETLFDGKIRADDPHQTYYNLGQRDVVQYLRELRDYHE